MGRAAPAPDTTPPRPRSEVMAGPVAAEVLRVIDGDTLSVRAQVWIGQALTTDVRIAGIDTPELRGKCQAEREKAEAARAALSRLVTAGTITLTNIKLEKYGGRVLAHVLDATGTSVGDQLIKQGLARPYAGAKRDGWCKQADASVPAQTAAISGQE